MSVSSITPPPWTSICKFVRICCIWRLTSGVYAHEVQRFSRWVTIISAENYSISFNIFIIPVMQAIATGAKMGLEECQYQFRNNRWNCTTSSPSIDLEDIYGEVVEISKLPVAENLSVSNKFVLDFLLVRKQGDRLHSRNQRSFAGLVDNPCLFQRRSHRMLMRQ